jgi:hypothetical protein
MEYAEALNRVTYGVMFVAFKKKDGTIRKMMCTRDVGLVNNINSALTSYEANGMLMTLGGRSNESNGNIAVIDLEIMEARTFNCDRLVGYEYMNIPNSYDQFCELMSRWSIFKNDIICGGCDGDATDYSKYFQD